MKIITRDILDFQASDFAKPIRDKSEYAKVLVLAARILLLNFEAEAEPCSWRLKLLVDKMSRIFFYTDRKYFSVAFPFSVVVKGNEVHSIVSKSGRAVDNKAISDVISVLNDWDSTGSHSLIDFYVGAGANENALFLLEEIFQSEPSYIRYDFDDVNEDGNIHPLNHLDINYSQYGTFKLGLENVIDEDCFEDIQNILTECHFLIDKSLKR